MAKHDNLDQHTLSLVRLAAAVAQGYEPELRERIADVRRVMVPIPWVEELLLQSILMAGYPRTLIAFGIWRKLSRVPAPESDLSAEYSNIDEWTRQGEETWQRIDAREVAASIGTIPWEIVCRLGTRIERQYDETNHGGTETRR